MKKNEKESHIPRCTSKETVLMYYEQLFRLYLKLYRAWQIYVIACKSVIEALNILNISSELEFSTDLALASTHLQYLFSTFILLKLIYLFL